jgi:cytochrome bd-type quinol oxidase subunit 2
MQIQMSGISLRGTGGDGVSRIVHSCRRVAVNRTFVSGVFLSLLLSLILGGVVSGIPITEAEMIAVQRDSTAEDMHLAYYAEHLVRLGIDRLNCR